MLLMMAYTIEVVDDDYDDDDHDDGNKIEDDPDKTRCLKIYTIAMQYNYICITHTHIHVCLHA